jgi:hypothetical protein
VIVGDHVPSLRTEHSAPSTEHPPVWALNTTPPAPNVRVVNATGSAVRLPGQAASAKFQLGLSRCAQARRADGVPLGRRQTYAPGPQELRREPPPARGGDRWIAHRDRSAIGRSYNTARPAISEPTAAVLSGQSFHASADVRCSASVAW